MKLYFQGSNQNGVELIILNEAQDFIQPSIFF